jgi:hypothetical protein
MGTRWKVTLKSISIPFNKLKKYRLNIARKISFPIISINVAEPSNIS